METETKIVKRNNIGELSETDLKQLELANIIPKGTPLPQVHIFATVCREKSLSPFQKQIYLLPFKKKSEDKWETHYACIVGIDGYRTIAERTGKYAGSDDAKFNDDKTEFQCREKGLKYPTTATVTVFKIVKGQRVPYTATAGWESYVPMEGKRFNWNRMPFLQLGKCAEALALRKAFPEALSGLHAEEESGGFEDIKDAEEIKKVDISANILIKYKSEIDKYLKREELIENYKKVTENAVDEGLNKQHQEELQKYINKQSYALKQQETPKQDNVPPEHRKAVKSSENSEISEETIKGQLPLMPITE